MDERLTLGPGWVQAIKPALTRLRTAAWRARGRPRRAGLRVLFYHRVSDDPDPLAIAPRRFADQMDLLAAEGYRVVDVVEAARLLTSGERLDSVVALSFDDGYRDVAEHALPVLEQRQFRATVFVATGVADGTATFSWYARQPPVLGWTTSSRSTARCCPSRPTRSRTPTSRPSRRRRRSARSRLQTARSRHGSAAR